MGDNNNAGDGSKKMIGSWMIIKQLGQGSFGDVFVGEHEETGKMAAVKVIDTCKWEEKSKARRTKLLKREIRFSRLLNHPNIIKMIDTMVDGTKVILALEHIPGGDLEMYIEAQKKRRIQESKCRDLFRQVVSGIDYLHKNSIIHRDVKPANVMLDETHSIPKLIDFGFTTAYDKDKEMYSFLGSPHYAAPELLQGIKYDGPKVDIWSLGVTLYTMLTGMLPFQAQTMEALLNLIVNAKFTIPDYVPSGPADLIKKMLVVDMSKRIAMEEVRHHFWILEDHNGKPPDDLAISRETPITEIDEEVFNALKDFEFNDEDNNHKALAAAQPSKIKNVYCLLLEARNRADAERIEEQKLKEARAAERAKNNGESNKNEASEPPKAEAAPQKSEAGQSKKEEKPKPTRNSNEQKEKAEKKSSKHESGSEKKEKQPSTLQTILKAIFSPFSKKKDKK